MKIISSSSSNFHQYVSDSEIQSHSAEELEGLIESKKNGPVTKGIPIIDLKLEAIKNFPSNLKFISNKENKLQKH